MRLQVWSGQAADLATPTSQDAWSDQVRQALPDVVILKSQSLGGRQPARLLSCWERLLGQGYSHVYKATPHGDAVMLVKEPWMVEAQLSDMSTSRQTVTVKGGPLLHALGKLDAAQPPRKRSNQIELNLTRALIATLPAKTQVTQFGCPSHVAELLKRGFADSPTPELQVTVAMTTAEQDISCSRAALQRMQADRGSWALLLSLRQAIQTNAFDLKHLQFCSVNKATNASCGSQIAGPG